MILRRQVQFSFDDAWKRITTSYWSKTIAILYVGDVSGGTNQKMGAAFRFLDIPLPRGAIITHAYLTFTSHTSQSGTTLNSRIKGEAADDPPPSQPWSTSTPVPGRQPSTGIMSPPSPLAIATTAPT